MEEHQHSYCVFHLIVLTLLTVVRTQSIPCRKKDKHQSCFYNRCLDFLDVVIACLACLNFIWRVCPEALTLAHRYTRSGHAEDKTSTFNHHVSFACVASFFFSHTRNSQFCSHNDFVEGKLNGSLPPSSFISHLRSFNMFFSCRSVFGCISYLNYKN